MNGKLGTALPPPETIHTLLLVVIGKTHPTNVVGNPDVHVKRYLLFTPKHFFLAVRLPNFIYFV